MIKKAIVFAVAAACLTSGAAFAQSSDYRNDRNDGDHRGNRYERQESSDRYDRHDRNDRNDRQYGERRDQGRDYGRNDGYSRHDGYGRNDRNASRWDNNRGYGNYGQQTFRMQRGERFDQYYRGDSYVVSDWRSRRLYEPQRGYHWVQAGNDYALVAIATGIIASVLLNH